MPSTLTSADVLRIAELARLELSDEEVELFSRQITDILGYAEQVRDVDTSGVSPTSHPLDVQPSWREDVVQPGLDRAVALSNAPDADREAGLFKVPKVL
jgi:aspartyl-tRNA(Asn)/glutamyl-tRNA(Gln) amidotransferase subunit C